MERRRRKYTENMEERKEKTKKMEKKRWGRSFGEEIDMRWKEI